MAVRQALEGRFRTFCSGLHRCRNIALRDWIASKIAASVAAVAVPRTPHSHSARSTGIHNAANAAQVPVLRRAIPPHAVQLASKIAQERPTVTPYVCCPPTRTRPTCKLHWRRQGPYIKVRFDMLPIQLPIVPVNLFAPSELHGNPQPSEQAMRSGAGPSQQSRIRRVRENGTYRPTRSVSRPSSGGSVPPSPLEARDLRQPTRIASTAPAPPAAQDPPRAIADRNPG